MIAFILVFFLSLDVAMVEAFLIHTSRESKCVDVALMLS